MFLPGYRWRDGVLALSSHGTHSVVILKIYARLLEHCRTSVFRAVRSHRNARGEFEKTDDTTWTNDLGRKKKIRKYYREKLKYKKKKKLRKKNIIIRKIRLLFARRRRRRQPCGYEWAVRRWCAFTTRTIYDDDEITNERGEQVKLCAFFVCVYGSRGVCGAARALDRVQLFAYRMRLFHCRAGGQPSFAWRVFAAVGAPHQHRGAAGRTRARKKK